MSHITAFLLLSLQNIGQMNPRLLAKGTLWIIPALLAFSAYHVGAQNFETGGNESGGQLGQLYDSISFRQFHRCGMLVRHRKMHCRSVKMTP